MLFAVLVCSDPDCPTTYEAYGDLEELEVLVCDDCGCSLQVVGYAYTSLNRAEPEISGLVLERAA
jgi:hypothetical protein